ncbi:PP2C family protein-serine/threonine phosphatase [Streptomyces sp. NPDC091272]|uniref:PP2C family protein-serine/threonine phosphatase n=1 Tax=Streptomyces sp. NPDC091272 TaxID=3365981 RepID=UPI0038013B97
MQPPDTALTGFLADPLNLRLDLATSITECTRSLGLDSAAVYLADLQQRHLLPLDTAEDALGVDDSLAGACYRTQSPRVGAEQPPGPVTAWLPLVDGSERLGVMAVRAPRMDEDALRRAGALAALCAMMITSKRAYKDTFVRRARTEDMTLAAEMLRAYLPPRTIGSPRVVSTAVLEPAYEIGGDAFDHALSNDTLHAAIVDAAGHNLASGLTTVVSLAACRNARRTGATLPELVESVDAALSTWLPQLFCTAVLSQLDLASGRFRWLNCGHPAPLLLRAGRVVPGALERTAEPPMGLPALFSSTARHVHEVALEPGDRVLMYTDGVVESRTIEGKQLGIERFIDQILLATAAEDLAPETLRRVIHSLLDAPEHKLSDDATILMLEWCPDD